MHKLLTIFLLASIPVYCSGQNIVQNGDFNLTQPGFHSGFGVSFHLMDYWNDSDTNTSKRCGSLHKSNCGPPFNGSGCPGAYSANSYHWPLPYAGLGLGRLGIFWVDSSWMYGLPYDSRISNVRNELASSLVEDTLYCTEIHVMLVTEPSQQTNMEHLCITHNGLGMYFSDSSTLPSSRPWDDGIVPQVANFGYITNDTVWQKLKGSFVAQGNEQYLFIGNYAPLSDPPLQVIFNNCYTTPPWSSLWFDAVYVYNCRDTLFSVIQKDTTVCFGQAVVLNPELKGFKLQDSIVSYHWQTPSTSITTTSPTFTASEPGIYQVEVTINKRFKSAITFHVNWIPELPDTNLVADSMAVCPGEPLTVSAPEILEANYYWSNGDTARHTTIGQAGMYSLEVSTSCWLYQQDFWVYQENCGDRIFIPNAFTPDGDGRNDYFELFGPLEPFTLIVTDRWGAVVYQSNNYQNNWDGTYLGKDLPAGVYTYRILHSVIKGGPLIKEEYGTISIVR